MRVLLQKSNRLDDATEPSPYLSWRTGRGTNRICLLIAAYRSDSTMSQPLDNEPAPPTSSHPRRLVFLGMLLIAAAAFAIFWYGTATGSDLRHRHVVHLWMNAHPFLAPLALIGLYMLLSLSIALPVWPLQLIAGRSLGLIEGIIVCEIGSTLAAGLSAWMAEWAIGDVFRRRVESKIKKLRDLEQKLDHNGLLVVMATRLLHVVPFGLSNYLFGLLGITVRQVMVGTFLGNLPAVCWYVGLGAYSDLGWRNLSHHWIFFSALLALNLLLLGLLRLRYLRPEWFRKIGVE